MIYVLAPILNCWITFQVIQVFWYPHAAISNLFFMSTMMVVCYWYENRLSPARRQAILDRRANQVWYLRIRRKLYLTDKAKAVFSPTTERFLINYCQKLNRIGTIMSPAFWLIISPGLAAMVALFVSHPSHNAMLMQYQIQIGYVVSGVIGILVLGIIRQGYKEASLYCENNFTEALAQLNQYDTFRMAWRRFWLGEPSPTALRKYLETHQL